MTTFKTLESNQDLGRNKQNLYQKTEILRWCVSIQETKKHGFDPWVRKIPWSRKWQPTPVFLPGNPMNREALWTTAPWGCKESDTAEHACREREILENTRQTNRESDCRDYCNSLYSSAAY